MLFFNTIPILALSPIIILIFAFGSVLAMGLPARWSSGSVYAGGFVLPGERTLFGGVHAVPPGHFLRATHPPR